MLKYCSILVGVLGLSVRADTPYNILKQELAECRGDKKPTGPCGGRPVDLVVLVDGSASIEEDAYRELQTFLKTLVSGLHTKKDGSGTRMSLIQFSTGVGVAFGKNGKWRSSWSATGLSDKTKLTNAIDSMKQRKRGTKLNAALKYVDNHFIKQVLRSNAVQLLVVITDGQSQDGFEHIHDIKRRNRHLTVISVGVGSEKELEFLKAIASPSEDPKLPNYQYHASYKALGRYTQKFMGKMCVDLGYKSCMADARDKCAKGAALVAKDLARKYAKSAQRRG